MTGDLQAYLVSVATKVEAELEILLPPAATYPSSIHSLMRYSMFAGGKRVRPALIMAAYECCGGNPADKKPIVAGAAIEMLHTFSLIHDDLPCMDDDDFRRGKPTAHKAYTEGLAVLGGDALCIYAYECLAKLGRIDCIDIISKALGTAGMIGGQVVDIESEGKPVTRETVEYIHHNKTAALLKACVQIGALLADASEKECAHLATYGNAIGMAFQIVDDILDEESTTATLGKDAGSDRARGKATFPAVVGMSQSKQCASDLINVACRELNSFGNQSMRLTQLAHFIRDRIS